MTLRFDNIYKAYDKELFHGLTIHFGAVGLVGVVGRSGTGKTTLINCIGGLEKIDRGTIEYGSLPITAWKKHALKNISYLYQFYNLLPALTVKENIEFGLYCKQQEIPNYTSLLQRLDIASLLERYPYQLSGGQKQRVALARAFLCDSPILLCDEPTGALHQELGHQVMKLLEDYSKQHLVVVVSHDKEMLNQYTKKIIDFDDLQHYYYFSNRTYSLCKKKKYRASFLDTCHYCLRQFLFKKKTYIQLFVLQAITISCFLLLLSAKTGLEQYFLQSYEQYTLKNVVEIQKLDYMENSFSEEEVEIIGEDQKDVYYDYQFSRGKYENVEETITTIPLPTSHNHIQLLTGDFPSGENEVLISNQLFQVYKEDSIIYELDNIEYEFKIVGVIEDTMMNSCFVCFNEFYIDDQLLDTIRNNTKIYVELINTEQIDAFMEKYNNDTYFSYSNYISLKQGQESLFLMGKVVGSIFMGISFSISLLLIQLVFYALLYQRRKDSAIAFSYGMSPGRLASIFGLEGFLVGGFCALGGILLGNVVVMIAVVWQPLQEMISIEQVFCMPSIQVDFIIFILYSTSCCITAFLVARKMARFRCSEVIKEE